MTATHSFDRVLPTGTVTFLFSDIEGSTRLLHEHGDGYVGVLAEHRRILRAAFAAHDGFELGTEGDSFFVAFARASDAVAAATAGQRDLEGGPVRVRMGLHTGEPWLTAEGYVGTVVHRAARIAAAAHGGQVLVSQAVADLTADRLPVDAGLRDLGSVRLKDLGAPEHIYQITHPQLRESFPPLRSLEATPNNLPQQTTSFVGREREIAAIKTLLNGTRLLTLTGSGGCGKTRLSLHAAADVVDHYLDGVWLVELAALADPGLVPQTVATVLGVKEEPGKPVLDTLGAQLQTKRLLLILDNCEHLLDACAKVADALVRRCPEVTILASSREALGIAGEQTYRVPSLSLPDRSHAPTPQSLSIYESVRLFIDRALLARAEFAVTNRNAPALASLCHHLDGIPLAIELAAARVRSLSVEEIDRKLDQRFRLLTGGSRTALPRHQTLRALIDWSYDLLRDAEQLLLQRLSVFAGGWTLEAAEAVCAGEGVEGVAILDLLTSLIDKSLVLAEQTEAHSRYRLLETVRQYATERLREGVSGDVMRERHRNYFLELAELAEPKLLGVEQGKWLCSLEEDHENLRASLEWSLTANASEGALRFCGALHRFWEIRGHVTEGREYCARALAKSGAHERTRERASTLNAAGSLAYRQSDFPASRACYEEGLTIRRELGDRRGIAQSLNGLGNIVCDQGDYATCEPMYEESLAIYRELGLSGHIATVLGNLGVVKDLLGNVDAARNLYSESLTICREQGNGVGTALMLNNLGVVASNLGELAFARELQNESLAIRRQLGDRMGIADSLSNLTSAAFEQGDFAAAREYAEEGLVISRGLGLRRVTIDFLEEMAAVCSACGNPTHAARVWGAAERQRDDIPLPRPETNRADHERLVAAARSALGDAAAFDRAWQEGRALTFEQAIELALEESVERK